LSLPTQVPPWGRVENTPIALDRPEEYFTNGIASSVKTAGSFKILLNSTFLPPFARLRFYTYPNPRDTDIVSVDCFWSAMNFLNTMPDAGFFNPNYLQKVLFEEYVKSPEARISLGTSCCFWENKTRLFTCAFILPMTWCSRKMARHAATVGVDEDIRDAWRI